MKESCQPPPDASDCAKQVRSSRTPRAGKDQTMNPGNDNTITGASLNRRQLLRGAAAAGVTLALGSQLGRAAEGKTVTKGNVKQSIVFWCFNTAGEKWDVEKTCQVAKDLGCPSVEIVDPKDWAV